VGGEREGVLFSRNAISNPSSANSRGTKEKVVGAARVRRYERSDRNSALKETCDDQWRAREVRRRRHSGAGQSSRSY